MQTEPDVELWQEFFELLIRGGMLPDRARAKVARASGQGDELTDLVYARWRAAVDALIEAALKDAG